MINAKAGHVEELDFQWFLDAAVTAVEVRAYITELDGARKYWNGSTFAAPDATLTADSFAGSRWRLYAWTWPAAAIGREVTIEAKPTAPATASKYVHTHTRRVVQYLPDDVHAEVDSLEEQVGTSADAANASGNLHQKVRSLLEEHDGTVISVERNG